MDKDRFLQLNRHQAVACQATFVLTGIIILCDGSLEMRSWQVMKTCRTVIIRKIADDRFHKVFDRYVKVVYSSFLYLCSC